MPEGFDRCRAQGGKIRTVSGPNKMMGLGKGQYMHLCIIKGNVHRGEIKTKKDK
jgi:hypothetical protein